MGNYLIKDESNLHNQRAYYRRIHSISWPRGLSTHLAEAEPFHSLRCRNRRARWEKRQEGVCNCMKKFLRKSTVKGGVDFWFLHPVMFFPFRETWSDRKCTYSPGSRTWNTLFCNELQKNNWWGKTIFPGWNWYMSFTSLCYWEVSSYSH